MCLGIVNILPFHARYADVAHVGIPIRDDRLLVVHILGGISGYFQESNVMNFLAVALETDYAMPIVIMFLAVCICISLSCEGIIKAIESVSQELKRLIRKDDSE